MLRYARNDRIKKRRFAAINIDFLKRSEEPEILLLLNQKKEKLFKSRNLKFYIGVILICFSLTLVAGYAANYEAPLLAALFVSAFFLLGLKVQYFLDSRFYDRISDKQIRRFLTDFQSGRRIQIAVSGKNITIDIGGETETVPISDLTKIEIHDELVCFEKESLLKAYIPKRACTDEQWTELVTLFSERKPSEA